MVNPPRKPLLNEEQLEALRARQEQYEAEQRVLDGSVDDTEERFKEAFPGFENRNFQI